MDSPYQMHLDTNYVPSVDEAVQIQKILEVSAKEISELDAQVSILQKQLDVLQAKRAEIHVLSERHRALLSPMRKLTGDILEEIFLACLPTDRNPCMSAVEAPMLLTRICSSWRQIAHSTPRIWAKIHIALPVITLGEFSGERDVLVQETLVRRILKLREKAVAEWLGRSYACPLSISIFQTSSWVIPELLDRHHINTICEELQQLHLSLINNSIIPHHKRWRDLDIYVVGDTLRFLDLGFKNKCPMLESLHITHRESRHLDTNTLPRYQLKDVASLITSYTTSATFHFFPIRNSNMASISVQPWRKLTELNLKFAFEQSSGPVNWTQFTSSILRQCHSLIILKFDSLAFHEDSGGLTELIILRHLTTLSIVLPATPCALDFAKSLYLPSLKNLDIDLPRGLSQFLGTGQETVVPEDIIKSLLRTCEDFYSLKFHPLCFKSVDDMVQLLKCIPDIRSLKMITKHINHEKWSPLFHMGPQIIYRHLINDGFLRALMPTDKLDSEIVCPRLEEFECDYNLITGITEAFLKEFMVSRQSDERVSSLRRISVFINEPKDNSCNAEKVPMGMDSAVYFRRPLPVSAYSPFEGFEDNFKYWLRHGTETLVSDCHNCI